MADVLATGPTVHDEICHGPTPETRVRNNGKRTDLVQRSGESNMIVAENPLLGGIDVAGGCSREQQCSSSMRSDVEGVQQLRIRCPTN
jgi:hypothetical protein